jgi:hypothetical protein
LDAASGLVEAGQRSMQALLQRPGIVLVDESSWPEGFDRRTFADVDTPMDLVHLGLTGVRAADV